jgi:hypothetical protein
MGPAGWLIMSLSVIGGYIASVATKTKLLDDATLEHIKTQIDQHKVIGETIDQYDALRMKAHLTTDEFARYLDINTLIQKQTDPKIIAGLTEEQNQLAQKSGLSNDELKKMVDLNSDLIQKVPEASQKITDQGNAILDNTNQMKKYNEEQLKADYKKLDLERLKTETEYSNLLKKESDTVDKLKGQEDKLQTLQNDKVKLQQTANTEQQTLNHMLANTSKIFTRRNKCAKAESIERSTVGRFATRLYRRPGDGYSEYRKGPRRYSQKIGYYQRCARRNGADYFATARLKFKSWRRDSGH